MYLFFYLWVSSVSSVFSVVRQNMKEEFISHSPKGTIELGKEIAVQLSPGDIVGLIGELGTGKTLLAQAIAKTLGVKDYVTSPTFKLINEYQGKFPVYHLDLFRLNNFQIQDLGLEEYLFGNGISIIEWAEKIRDWLPEHTLIVELSYLSKTSRKITIKKIKNLPRKHGIFRVTKKFLL